MFVRGSDLIKLYRSLPKKEIEIIFFTLLIMTTYLHYRMKAKLKVPRRCSNKKDASAAIEFKNN